MEPKREKRYMPEQIFALAILGLLFLVAVALPIHAASTVVVVNDSGTYVDGDKLSQRPDVVEVYISSSTQQDASLQWPGRFVCLSTEGNCSNAVNLAINSSTSKTIHLNGKRNASGDYTLITFGSGVNDRINLCGMNGTTIIGDGPTKTMFIGNGFFVNCNTPTHDITIIGIKTDLNNTANNAVNFNVGGGGSCENCRVKDFVGQNTSNAFAYHGVLCGGGIRDSTFIDAGLTSSKDNIAITNNCDTRRAIVDNVQSIKINSQGGGALTNGGSRNLEITNFFCSDPSGRSYACISMEGQSYDFEHILIDGVITNYSGNRFGYVAVDDQGYGRTAKDVVIRNVQGLAASVILRANNGVYASSISGVVSTGADGAPVTIGNCIAGCAVSDVVGYNFNYNGQTGAGASTRACVRVENSAGAALSVDDITCDTNITNGTIYGLRFVNTSNVSVGPNIVMHGISTANEYTFSTSADIYIPRYLYTSLPTCDGNSTSRGLTLSYNASGNIYQVNCQGGQWNTIGNGTGGWSSNGAQAVTTLNGNISSVNPLLYFTQTGGASIRYDMTSNRMRMVQSATIVWSGNATSMSIPTVGLGINIGTSTPTQKLEVNGSINISSSTGQLYMPGITYIAGSAVCYNTTSKGFYVNTTCP